MKNAKKTALRKLSDAEMTSVAGAADNAAAQAAYAAAVMFNAMHCDEAAQTMLHTTGVLIHSST